MSRYEYDIRTCIHRVYKDDGTVVEITDEQIRAMFKSWEEVWDWFKKAVEETVQAFDKMLQEFTKGLEREAKAYPARNFRSQKAIEAHYEALIEGRHQGGIGFQKIQDEYEARHFRPDPS